jgi:hypothetical protein
LKGSLKFFHFEGILLEGDFFACDFPYNVLVSIEEGGVGTQQISAEKE